MEQPWWITVIITIIVSFIGSGGFWAFMQSRYGHKDLQSQMLVGLGHDRIVYLGLKYIERGYITQEEFENLHDYLYVPYHKMGGNGSAERVIEHVKKLPPYPPTHEEHHDAHEHHEEYTK